MEDIEWKQFIKEIVEKNKHINLKEECQKRQVGLNTLYRKLSKLEQTDNDLYNQFVSIYPYKPRDIQGIDFEQLMRESMLTGISQKELENKYGIPKRTIQRKFAEIRSKNAELYSIYQIYTKLKSGQQLYQSVIEKLEAEYVPQTVVTEEIQLDNRRKKFVESLHVAKEKKNWQLYRHYVEQIERIDKQQSNKGIKEGEEK